jgi:nickel-dependent lactate racemase
MKEHYVICEGERLCFSLPPGWKVITSEDRPPVPGVADPIAEIRRALDNPIGSPRIEEIARPGMDVVLLFDDVQRPTPAHLALPEIMNRLNRAGVSDERITAVCAVGTHPRLDQGQLEQKVGKETVSRLPGRVICHDPYSLENIVIGKTHRGITVEVNRHVAAADLVIGVGDCMPHPCSGYGGGYKIVMPGVASYRSVADHHFTWLRHRDSKVHMMDGNGFYEEIVDAGRLARLAFKLDLVINDKKEIIRAFAGETTAEHREAAKFSSSLYWVPMPKVADVTITSAYPMEIAVQATKALTMAKFCTRSGGTIIWVAPQREGAVPIMPLIREMGTQETASDFHRRLIHGDIPDELRSLGISYIMQIVFFKELSEKFRVIHVTEGLKPDEVAMMKFTHAQTLPDAIDIASQTMPEADVAIFPSGGNIIPGVAV